MKKKAIKKSVNDIYSCGPKSIERIYIFLISRLRSIINFLNRKVKAFRAKRLATKMDKD